jgi:hypothetical protein
MMLEQYKNMHTLLNIPYLQPPHPTVQHQYKRVVSPTNFDQPLQVFVSCLNAMLLKYVQTKLTSSLLSILLKQGEFSLKTELL